MLACEPPLLLLLLDGVVGAYSRYAALDDMTTVTLPTGATVPALGLGTWRMGESHGTRTREVAAVRFAIAIGYRLIDTAEMYGEGGAEEAVGAAVADAVTSRVVRREDLFVVSKVYPHNASREGVPPRNKRPLAMT